MFVYLDHNATTPLLTRARAAMEPWLGDMPGNPSSVHGHGQAARAAVDGARRELKAFAGGSEGELIFTGSGTEAVFAALVGAATLGGRSSGHVVVSAIEHAAGEDAAVRLESLGFSVTRVLPDVSGRVSAASLAAAFREDTVLVSLMHANNETGVVQPVAEVGEQCRARRLLFHVDAVQSAGKLALEATAWGADLVSLAAHKLGGPQGVGALWHRSGLTLPAVIPGAQEGGSRGGTHNVAGIVGFAAAAGQANPEGYAAAVLPLRDGLEDAVRRQLPGVVVHGDEAPRLPNTVQMTFDPNVGGDLVPALDMAGFSVSAGSACASGSQEPSRVLSAMGVSPDRARTAVRVSLGRGNTADETAAFVDVLAGLVGSRASLPKVSS